MKNVKSKELTVGKNVVNIPGYFGKMDSMPNDPEGSVAMGYHTSMAFCFSMIYPLAYGKEMPLDNKQMMIDSIHGFLTDGQGLIVVENGKTSQGEQFAYSIVKSRAKPSGMQYILTLQIAKADEVINVSGYFQEEGRTGIRDSMVFELLARENVVKISENGMEGWFEDPYDSTFKVGLPMNKAEDEQFDEMFPEHPLSQIRAYAKFIIDNN